MQPESWNELAAQAAAQSDLLAVKMDVLRALKGRWRLGAAIWRSIPPELKRCGLAYFPDPLPRYGKEWVFLFNVGTPMERLIRHVYLPTPVGRHFLQHSSYLSDPPTRAATLRHLVKGDVPTLLRKIEELASQQ